MKNIDEQIDKLINKGGAGYWDCDMPKLAEELKMLFNGELSTLIQKEREGAVRGFVDILVNVLGGELADKHYGDDIVEETLNVTAVQIVNEVYKRYDEKK